MLKIIRFGCFPLKTQLLKSSPHHQKCTARTFLSQAYYCDESWNNRLNTPLLQKVNPELLYHELDQRFQKTSQISAVDIDIFANSLKDDLFTEELLDLAHKLRLSTETGKTLESTPHAIVRTLVSVGKTDDLLNTLDDRLNYGVFLDYYTANLLMDIFWKKANYAAGASTAGQIMLQEEWKHPVTRHYAILHCYNYLLKGGEWPKPVPPPEEPEEVVKIRVRYLKNPFDDQHFDLKEPLKIVGKTLAFAATDNNPIHLSLRTIGWALYGKEGEAKKSAGNEPLITEIVNLLPDDNAIKQELLNNRQESNPQVNEFLQQQVVSAAEVTSDKDIANQCKLYERWQNERVQALEEQKQRILTAARLAEVDKLKKSIEEKEQKLWFFENEENIEVTLEEQQMAESAKSQVVVKEKSGKKKEDDLEYIPPEVKSRK